MDIDERNNLRFAVAGIIAYFVPTRLITLFFPQWSDPATEATVIIFVGLASTTIVLLLIRKLRVEWFYTRD